MTPHQHAVAQQCLDAAYDQSMSFPQIVGALMAAGFESYSVDYRRHTATYVLPNGQGLDLPTPTTPGAIAPAFSPPAIETAIREAQANGPEYSYRGFCTRVKAAGCAGYMVSFLGRRAVYFGRDGAVHVESFPE